MATTKTNNGENKMSKCFEVLVNDTLEALENYAKIEKLIYPDDIGYMAVKKQAIKVLKTDSVKSPGEGLIRPIVNTVYSELATIQFEKYGLGINPW
jgi:hypothetical protein